MTGLRSAVAAAYLIGALMAFIAARTSPARDRRLWIGAAAVLMLMGVAKQAQLQDLIAGTARSLLKAAGWYDWHENAQRLIAGLVLAAFLAAFTLLGSRLRESEPSTKAAAASLLLLVTFVLIRAASFHAMDAWVVRETLGMRTGWWIELAGIAAIGGSALACLTGRKRASRRATE